MKDNLYLKIDFSECFHYLSENSLIHLYVTVKVTIFVHN